jgi:hypothetical protein
MCYLISLQEAIRESLNRAVAPWCQQEAKLNTAVVLQPSTIDAAKKSRVNEMQMLIPTSKSSSSSKDSSSIGNDKLGNANSAGESTLSRALKSAEDKHQPFAQVTNTISTE